MKIQLRKVVSSVLLFYFGVLVSSFIFTWSEVNFIDIFDSKYAVIWSGVFGATIAAVISLVGVMSANRSSVDRLNIQHQYDKNEAIEQRKHEAEQKDEDRKAAIRREVYTKAVEEVHAVLAAIGGMPERPLSKREEDADGLQLFLKANAKVWLVAESEASHLSRELTNLMSELYLKTLQNAYPLRLAMEPVREIDKQLMRAEEEIQRVEVKIAELKEQQADAKYLEAAIASWKSAHDWLKALKAERERQINMLAPDRLAHAKAMFEEMRPTQRVIVKLVSSLRKELHLPGDEGQFLAELDDMEKRALAVLDRAYGL